MNYLESYNLYRDGVFLANTGLSTNYADSNINLDDNIFSINPIHTYDEHGNTKKKITDRKRLSIFKFKTQT